MFAPAIWMAAAAAVSAVGAVYSANSQAAAMEGEANQAKMNAKIASQQAGAREDMQRRENALRLGEQRAAFAQSGFDPSSGSALTLQGQSAANAELDALTTRYEGQLQALSFNTQANNLKRQASSTRSSGYLNAAGSLLGTVGKSYGRT